MGENNVLSLFDGMACAKQALDMANFKYDNYYASEVDKAAVKFTSAKHPSIIHLGDVRLIDTSKLPPIKYLFGGSPCQSFSMAGKMKGMATKCELEITTLEQYLELKEQNFEFEGQSYLFWEYIRILRDVKPQYFMLENVEMVKRWERVLTDAIGVPSIKINSALQTAQNRVRIYWKNWGNAPQGLFGDLANVTPQPKDLGILLKDILQKDVPEKYYLSDKMMSYFNNRAANFNQGKVNIRDEEGKASCITASMASCDISDNFIAIDCSGKEYSDKSGTVLARYHKGPSNFGSDTYIKVDKNLVPKANQNKASCFTAGGNSGGNHSDMDLILKWLEKSDIVPDNAKSIVSDTTTDNLLLIQEATTKGYVQIAPGECFDAENPKSKTRRGRKMEDKSNTVMAQQNQFMHYTPDYRIRRLTPIEVCRLQGVADDYFFDENGNQMTADTNIYKMCGNGWTIPMIAHLLEQIV